MRILAFGDIHLALGAIPGLLHGAAADLVLITGDLTTWGGRRETRQVVEKVLEHCSCPVLAVPGNMDRPEAAAYLTEQGLNLDGRGTMVNGIGIFGLGGSNFTPFHTPLEFSEEELATRLAAGHQEVRTAGRRILLSHCPPVNTLTDRLRDGSHVGSRAVRDLIEREQPDLCLCGHIHEARAADRLGRTALFNPGLLQEGGRVEISIDQTGLRAELREGR